MTAPAIRVELQGGFGNQLFQAAAALAVARRIDGRLQFETRRFRSTSLRGYGLAPFPHGAEIFNTQANAFQRLRRRAGKILPLAALRQPEGWRGRVLDEAGYAYDARIEDLRDSCYLRGYFQSWRYFADCAGHVRALFDPAQAASDSAKTFACALGPRALSIHLRAGDFLKDPAAYEFHGVLDRDYYHRAIALARAQRAPERIFCFSDNSAHARALLAHVPDVTFVEGFNQFDDMYLMSRAGSQIIANSTFSYWSAWLAAQDDPFVIAPKAWVAPRIPPLDIRDLYPPGWIQL
jgi:hypothetical protein